MKPRHSNHRRYQEQRPEKDHVEGKVMFGPQHRFALSGRLAEGELREARPESLDDGRQRLDHAHDARSCDRACADVEDVVHPDVLGRHVGDEVGRGEKRGGERVTEYFYRGYQDEVGKDAAGHHDRRDPGSDDITDAKKFGGELSRKGAAVVELEDLLRYFPPELEPGVKELVDGRDEEPGEDQLRLRSSLFADHQHLSAGGSFGVHQFPVLLDDEAPPEGDHHEDAEDASEEGDREHPVSFQVVAHQKYRRHREDDPGSDRFPGASRRLDYVVLEDRRPAEKPEESYRQDRDRYRRRNGHSDLEGEVDRRCREEDPQDGAQDDGFQRQFLNVIFSFDVGLELVITHLIPLEKEFFPGKTRIRRELSARLIMQKATRIWVDTAAVMRGSCRSRSPKQCGSRRSSMKRSFFPLSTQRSLSRRSGRSLRRRCPRWRLF